MKPIRTNESNFTYLGPVPRVADLPCRREDGAVSATFKLNDAERAAIAAGMHVEITIIGEPIPPLAISVVEQVEQPGADDLRCESCDALYTRRRELAICGHCGGVLSPEIQPVA